jgi:hypothetical protein
MIAIMISHNLIRSLTYDGEVKTCGALECLPYKATGGYSRIKYWYMVVGLQVKMWISNVHVERYKAYWVLVSAI